jgi:uncharacterized delta-60 repeat protein
MTKTQPTQQHWLPVLLFLLPSYCFAQVSEEWVRRYNGDPNSPDWARALAVDAWGKVSVTGSSWGKGTLNDYATIRYNEAGERQWTRRYNGPANGNDEAVAIAVDLSGNVYVTGWSESSRDGFVYDYATIKYDKEGHTKWIRRYNGPGNGTDQATALAVDAQGNLYVTGRSTGSGTGSDYATIKYDPDGNELWVRRYNGPANGADNASDLAVDLWGNVYVTGQSEGSGTGSDYATVRYDASGNELWVRRYNGPENASDQATALALDLSGNVHVTGESSSEVDEEGNSFSNYATIKYNPAGVEQWVAIFDGSRRDRANDIGVDLLGNVYVTGLSGPMEEDPDNDFATIKYNRDGVQQWVARFVTPGTASNSRANSLALDLLGNVYVTGQGAMQGGELDFVTIKYATNGTQQWVASHDGPGNFEDVASDIGLDARGNVYVTGRTRIQDVSDPDDFTTIKYSSTGVQQWIERYNGPGDANKGLTDQVNALGVDHYGHVSVTGSSTRNETGPDYVTIQYDEDGNRRWKRVYNGPGNGTDVANALTVDKKGNVYVTGGSDSSPDGFNNDFATIKYDNDGIAQWTRRYNGPGNGNDEATAIAVDQWGNVYVTGWSESSRGSFVYDYLTIKYDKEGRTQWTRRYNGPGNGFDIARAIAVDKEGHVYVTGESTGSGSGTDYATVKYNTNGNELWVARYNGTGNDFDEAVDLAVDDKGNVYVTGRSPAGFSNTNYATVKYNAAGVEQWAAQYDGSGGGFDGAVAVAVEAGNVFVTGTSQIVNGTGNDYATVKYDTNGNEQWAARYNGPLNGSDEAKALAVDKEGSVYVTGSSSGEYATVKYNAAGTEQWTIRYNGPGSFSDNPTALALDKKGNVYVTGSSDGDGTNDDYATIKYSQLSTITTRIESEPEAMASGVPAHFKVSHAPNPVATSARIQFELPLEGHVSIQVLDALGRTVATLVNATKNAGTYHTDFDASGLQKGLYYYRITVNTGQKSWVQTRKLLVAR